MKSDFWCLVFHGRQLNLLSARHAELFQVLCFLQPYGQYFFVLCTSPLTDICFLFLTLSIAKKVDCLSSKII